VIGSIALFMKPFEQSLLVPGTIYKWKMEAKNVPDIYSDESEILELEAGYISDVVTGLYSKNNGLDVDFAWVAPANLGAPSLISYTMTIETSMGPVAAPAGCGGSSLVTACTVSLETLRAAPYSFVDADPINFKVTATNKWGTSPDS